MQTSLSVSAEPLAWALERLGYRAAQTANNNEMARVAVSYLQLAGAVRQADSLQEAITITIAGLPPGSTDASGVDQALARALTAAGAPCVWEDCDQLAKYCEAHAGELVDPLGQIEELRACVAVVRELWEELAGELEHAFKAAAGNLAERGALDHVRRIWSERGLELGRKLGSNKGGT